MQNQENSGNCDKFEYSVALTTWVLIVCMIEFGAIQFNKGSLYFCLQR